jgi:thiamine biosynthesis lipoprotein
MLIGMGSGLGAVLLPRLALGAALETKALGGPAFGTYWRSVVPYGTDMRSVRYAVEEVIARVDRAMSPFRADSEISFFNRKDSTDWFEASPAFCDVARHGLQVAALTDGAFEPTIGPLVHRFGFGPIMGITGRHTDIEAGTGELRKAKAGLTLDLCGIAKGYALDAIVAGLEGAGLSNFFFELGGEVAASGLHPSGRVWQAGIERPLPGPETIERIVSLQGMALATSGTLANGMEIGGHEFGHIIDARTARPADNAIASVSVLAPTAMRADALATALLVMGVEVGAELAEREGVPALFLLRDGAGLAQVSAAGFDRHILA